MKGEQDMNRITHALRGEQGSSNMEIIVWMSVVLVAAVALFLFRDNIAKFVNNAAKQIGTNGANAGSWDSVNRTMSNPSLPSGGILPGGGFSGGSGN